jgi:hypothetical protein
MKLTVCPPDDLPRQIVIHRSILVISFLLMAGLAVSGMLLDSATDDEPEQIAAAVVKVKQGHFDFFNEQPPLITSLIALPLLFPQFNFPAVWEQVRNPWTVGKILMYRSGNDADQVLLLARLPIFLLFLLLCALVYFLILSLTRDRWYALLGSLFAGFCPNLLAHGRLATGDMGVTFFIFLSSLCFLRFLYGPNAVNTLLTGLFMGCAFLSKVSGLVLLPYFAALLLFFVLFERKFSWRDISGYLVRSLIIVLVALTLIELLYLLEMGHSYVHYSYPRLAETFWGRLVIPFMEYQKNVSAIYRWVALPYDKAQFLMGSFSSTGWWYYYIACFLLKTPLPAIVLFLFSCGTVAALGRNSFTAPDGPARRQYFHLFSLVFFVLLFLSVSSQSKLNIGLRYILPIYPFLYVSVALASFMAAARLGRARRPFLGFLTLCLLWSVISSVMAYPSYLSYFNELIGGRQNADRYLIDSNLDWGQDLKRLALWVDDNHVPAIYVHYFGGGEPQYYLGQRAMVISPGPRKPGYYAISRHLYRRSDLYRSRGTDMETYLKGARRVATIGESIYVFKAE